MSYKDKTWCASPQCEGKCGRRLSDTDKVVTYKFGQDEQMSYAYFCGVPDDLPAIDKLKAKFHEAKTKLKDR